MCEEIKERIALALIDADKSVPGSVPDYPELAAAVLGALQEPTDMMLVAAFDLGRDAAPRDVWQAMIEAART